MFYYLLTPIIKFNPGLIIAAIAPAIYWINRVYRADRLEQESMPMIKRLVRSGILATLIALVLERLGFWLLDQFVSPESPVYMIILYFGIVAFAEEGAKYFELRTNSWNSPEFNCQFDGILYAVLVALGFALWENVSYVLNYGFQTAVIRALTAVPGHASFGVFMGVFYSAAKKAQQRGDKGSMKFYSFLAVLIPALIHGAYDYIATMQTEDINYLFFIFIIILFIASNGIVKKTAKKDFFIS